MYYIWLNLKVSVICINLLLIACFVLLFQICLKRESPPQTTLMVTKPNSTSVKVIFTEWSGSVQLCECVPFIFLTARFYVNVKWYIVPGIFNIDLNILLHILFYVGRLVTAKGAILKYWSGRVGSGRVASYKL